QGQTYTNMRIGGNAAGPIAMDKVFYNSAYNFGRRFNDVQTLLNTSPAGIAAAGVAPDSAARLLGILRNSHVPINAANLPSLQAQDVAQAFVNVDISPSASGAGHSFTLSGAGNVQRTRPVSPGGLLLTTPAHAGEVNLWGGNLALVH